MSSAGETGKNASDHRTEDVALDEGTLVQDDAELRFSAEISLRGEEAPASIPGYEILRCLGEGAYGSVWLAREQNTGRQVAIKFYTHRRGLDWSLLNREVEKLAVLYTSRHIVRLLEVGWDNDPPFYVMEYLENGSLMTSLSEGPLAAHEAVRIVKSVLKALIHAHGSGILHCDLKPANVLLDANFEPRICDFGQSRLSDEQQPALGTLFYMAPEQANLDAVPDARWDVYALGALLYHLLCGEPPHRSPENERLISATGTLKERLSVYCRIINHPPQPNKHRKISGVDKRLADIVDCCLRIDPKTRFPNAQAVLDELEARDKQRSRRSLVALGVVVPFLLMAFMIPLAQSAMQEAVDTAQQKLVQRALESDVLSAGYLASSLAKDLENRKLELVRIAGDTAVRNQLLEGIQLLKGVQLLKSHPNSPGKSAQEREELFSLLFREREELFSLLEKNKQDSDVYRDSLEVSSDTSWFLADQQGFQRWRAPPNEKTIDRDYSFREYFRGLPEGTQSELRDPITKPHITRPFRSQATGRFMVAISVPVFDPIDLNTVIGVLARTTHLGELLDDYEQNIRGGNSENGEVIDRVVALVQSSDWKLLDHPWMTPDRLKNLPDDFFDRLTIDSPENSKLIEKLASSTNQNGLAEEISQSHETYFDPIAKVEFTSAGATQQYGGEWLAAFSPVGKTGWTVIVQERKSAATGPVEAIRGGLTEWVLWAVVLFLVLIILAWTFVIFSGR
jgi:serine/threonine protein kinase